MLKAGLKKELLYSVRTFRIIGIILTFGFFAVADPLLYYFLPKLMEMAGVNLSDLGELFAADAKMAMIQFASDIMQIGLLVFLLCLMGTAGGEQKKKSMVIPMCSGLTNTQYLLPKFILYPLLAFAVGVGSTFAALGVSALLFGSALDLELVAVSAISCGLFIAFMTALLLFVGILTGRPGIAIALIYILSIFAPVLLNALDINKYNPYALMQTAIMTTGFTKSFILTGFITVAAIPILFFLTKTFMSRKTK